MLDFQAARWLMDGEVPGQAGNDHPTVAPTGVFRTKDGRINIAASGQSMFRRLCETLGLPELLNDPRFEKPGDRSKNRDQLNAVLEQCLTQYGQEEIVRRLTEAGVPAGPILDIGQVFQNEQVKGLGLSAKVQSPELGEIEIQNTPYRLSRTPGGARSAAPERGQHTDEILAELGHSADDIRSLREARVV
jgi:formyl-CoA transferase